MLQFTGYSPSPRESRAGAQGRNKIEVWRNAAYRLGLCFSASLVLFIIIIINFLIQPRTTCLGNSTAHSELDSPMSSNKEDVSQICPQGNLT